MNDPGLYSRSAGLIENDALQRKRVLIIGLGSFGSQIAVDLAKSAVGSYALVDFDKLERHNVVRHACSLRDVGRLKTAAVEELILGKNPYAKVDKFKSRKTENRIWRYPLLRGPWYDKTARLAPIELNGGSVSLADATPSDYSALTARREIPTL